MQIFGLFSFGVAPKKTPTGAATSPRDMVATVRFPTNKSTTTTAQIRCASTPIESQGACSRQVQPFTSPGGTERRPLSPVRPKDIQPGFSEPKSARRESYGDMLVSGNTPFRISKQKAPIWYSCLLLLPDVQIARPSKNASCKSWLA